MGREPALRWPGSRGHSGGNVAKLVFSGVVSGRYQGGGWWSGADYIYTSGGQRKGTWTQQAWRGTGFRRVVVVGRVKLVAATADSNIYIRSDSARDVGCSGEHAELVFA